MIGNIFGPDLGIVLVIIIIVVLFGSQLPKLARNVGMAGREFRKAQQEAEEDAERERAAKAASTADAVNAATGSPAASSIAPAPAPPVLSVPVASEEKVTLTRSELDALLRAREEQARRETAEPGS
jgi:sec-independent protein translocase protein TatA